MEEVNPIFQLAATEAAAGTMDFSRSREEAAITEGAAEEAVNLEASRIPGSRLLKQGDQTTCVAEQQRDQLEPDRTERC